MSRVMRSKHVLKEMMEDDYKLPKHNQRIVRVVRSQGSNLFEVETANKTDKHFLVKMPTKFRNNIWIKSGNYILVDQFEGPYKVKGEICKILSPEDIKEYIKAHIWPESFAKKTYIENIKIDVQNNYVDSHSDLDDLEPNMNRPIMRIINDDTDEDNTDDDDDDDDDDNISSSEE